MKKKKKLKKIYRKGFTLVELLSVIVITSLVLIVAVYGIFKVKDLAKDKSLKLSLAGIKNSANLYSREAPSSEWRLEEKEGKESFEYFCVTIGELMNKGIIKKNSILPDGYYKGTFFFVKRNPLTKDVIGEYLPEEYDKNHNICNGYTYVNGETITKKAKAKESTSYTNKIEVFFEEGMVLKDRKNVVKGYECKYGSNINSLTDGEVDMDNHKCIISNINNGKKEGEENLKEYLVYIYMNTENGGKYIADDVKYVEESRDEHHYKTSNFSNTVIERFNNLNINIKYNNKDSFGHVINPFYKYFKSSLNATSSIPVIECGNDLNCNNVGTTNIIAGKWYLSNEENVNLRYELPSVDTNARVDTLVKDSSNNTKYNYKEFVILYDNLPPIINISNKFDGKWSNGKEEEYTYEVTFHDEEAGSGINLNSFKYSVGDKQSQEIKNNVISFDENGIVNYKYTVHVNSNQNNTITYEICDNADHCEIASTKVMFDNIPPVITFNEAKDTYNYDSGTGFNITSSCNDKISEIYSGVNEKNSVLSSNINLSTKDENVFHKCIDNAGNESSIKGNFKFQHTYKTCENAACGGKREECSTYSPTIDITATGTCNCQKNDSFQQGDCTLSYGEIAKCNCPGGYRVKYDGCKVHKSTFCKHGGKPHNGWCTVPGSCSTHYDSCPTEACGVESIKIEWNY